MRALFYIGCIIVWIGLIVLATVSGLKIFNFIVPSGAAVIIGAEFLYRLWRDKHDEY